MLAVPVAVWRAIGELSGRPPPSLVGDGSRSLAPDGEAAFGTAPKPNVRPANGKMPNLDVRSARVGRRR
jgi:hypothetical protein